jgi:hypothetical protein
MRCPRLPRRWLISRSRYAALCATSCIHQHNKTNSIPTPSSRMNNAPNSPRARAPTPNKPPLSKNPSSSSRPSSPPSPATRNTSGPAKTATSVPCAALSAVSGTLA